MARNGGLTAALNILVGAVLLVKGLQPPAAAAAAGEGGSEDEDGSSKEE